MGGGPRTFPGGLNKWQWKRMHEKKAREKEKKLLQQEKQLYEARVRSQIRASVAGSGDNASATMNFRPMTPDDHVKALADRFMKAGAEDLWNEDDGPLDESREQADPRRDVRPPSSTARCLDSIRQGEFGGNSSRFVPRRGFSCLPSSLDDSWNSWVDHTYAINSSRSDSSSLFDLLRSPIFIGRRNLRREYSTFYGRGEFVPFTEKERARGSETQSTHYAMGNVLGDVNVKNVVQNCHGSTCFSKKSLWRPESFASYLKDESGVYLRPSGNMLWKKHALDPPRYRNVGFSVNGLFSMNYSSFTGRHLNENMSFKKNSTLSDGFGRELNGKRMSARWSMSDSGEEENMEDLNKEMSSTKKGYSAGILRNHDVKRGRRVLERDINEGNFPQLTRMQLQGAEFLSGIGERSARSREESLLSQKRFDECDISPLTIKALNSSGYMQMTVVQDAALPDCLGGDFNKYITGNDVLVKAKTGTGKTAAFLLPAIEAVRKSSPGTSDQRPPPVLVLVLCPTRELASQIAAEATVLLKYHNGIGVQTLIGGTRFKVDQQRLESDPCQIIVATPGRLLDHIESRSDFSVRLMGLKVLILDEADLLLNLGFRKDIEKIVDCVPRQRQSILFSATIAKEVRRISQLVLKKDHVYIDTVGLGTQDTPLKVSQSYLVSSHENHFQIVPCILKEHIQQVVDYKVIVFCATTMVTSLMYHLLLGLKMNVREIHSRKPQLYRTRISDEFRESKRLILVTSDVSARGMDYPDVTMVVQVGIPSDREQYIHRLGRTGREGKDGKGVLLLAPWEEYFMDEIKDLPVQKAMLPQIDLDLAKKVENSLGTIDTSIKEAAYHAWLGYYNSIREIGRDKTRLVELANQFCHSIGLQRPPSMFRKTASKMGLRNIPGIQIRK